MWVGVEGRMYLDIIRFDEDIAHIWRQLPVMPIELSTMFL
jgi:hypothetical protein